MFVQFSDGNEAKIVAVFGSEQSPEHYDNLGVVGDDDPRLQAFFGAHADSWPNGQSFQHAKGQI